ncbi:hypothetical protein FACS1894158_00550 [Betaproteobacteria bacterium]|nr:hypothetical protein FACS1894158_00550 [Betaproteobacteria bacterium]
MTQEPYQDLYGRGLRKNGKDKLQFVACDKQVNKLEFVCQVSIVERKIMEFLKRFAEQKITVKHIEDFYRYSEVARFAGKKDRQDAFGSGIAFENTRENGKETYFGIMLYSSKSWAYVSIENGAVKYQYTENGKLRAMCDCPVTQNEKHIALITKSIMKWYREFGLPKSIEDTVKRMNELPKISIVNEIVIDGFDDEFPPVVRVFSDKTTSLILGIFPPRNKKITRAQANNFAQLIADATGKRVVHDDRETFVIFDDSQDMIQCVVSFLKAYSN